MKNVKSKREESSMLENVAESIGSTMGTFAHSASGIVDAIKEKAASVGEIIKPAKKKVPRKPLATGRKAGSNKPKAKAQATSRRSGTPKSRPSSKAIGTRGRKSTGKQRGKASR
jgi:hypothetical protein